MAEVRWTPQAIDDVEAICLFIARDAPSVAALFAQRAFDATDRLAAFPESGRVVPELNNPVFENLSWASIDSSTESDRAMFKSSRYTTVLEN